MLGYIILTVLALSLALLISMDAEKHTFGELFIMIVLSMAAVITFTLVLALDDGYEKGQVDAMKGHYKYEMKVETDTTFVKK